GNEVPISRIKGIDPAIAEVAHQEISGQIAEAGRCDGQAPRRIQPTASDQSHLSARKPRGAVQIEHVHKAMALTGHVIMPIGVLFGISDIELAVKKLNIKRSIAGWKVWVSEGVGSQACSGSKVGIEDIDISGPEVGSVQARDAAAVSGKGYRLIDGPALQGR